VKQIRDRYQPHARVAILSNSSTVGNPAVRAALELVDLKIMTFDAGRETTDSVQHIKTSPSDRKASSLFPRQGRKEKESPPKPVEIQSSWE
jgi:hypothetical protein